MKNKGVILMEEFNEIYCYNRKRLGWSCDNCPNRCGEGCSLAKEQLENFDLDEYVKKFHYERFINKNK